MESQKVATEIVVRLVNAGYTAYFAGGWVRDYLMGHPSDDIDIATNAPPEVIVSLFSKTILVGIAFGVVIVVERGHQFEVATFRRDIGYTDGRKPTQIELASPEEDAARRDFTINGMFYDPITSEVYDFVGGAHDIKARLIRTIGDPYERYVEDRLRMIRAVRFAARFDFVIDNDTEEAIRASSDTLFPAVAIERVWQELSKMGKNPHFDRALIDMHRLGLLETIFPQLKGVHLNEIKHRVQPFAYYAPKTPPVVLLMALFPKIRENDAIDICKYLRTSIADGVLAAFLVKVRSAAAKENQRGEVDLVEWVYLYADPAFDVCIAATAAHLPPLERGLLIDHHSARKERLKLYVECVINKKPLLTAAALQLQGVPPGKMMGKQLKLAERLAIEHEISDSELLMIKLKESALWREYVETVN